MPLVPRQNANGKFYWGAQSYDRIPDQTIIDFCNATGESLDVVIVAVRAEKSIAEAKWMKVFRKQEFAMKMHFYKDFSPKEMPIFPPQPENWFREFEEKGGLLKDEGFVDELMKNEEFLELYQKLNEGSKLKRVKHGEHALPSLSQVQEMNKIYGAI